MDLSTLNIGAHKTFLAVFGVLRIKGSPGLRCLPPGPPSARQLQTQTTRTFNTCSVKQAEMGWSGGKTKKDHNKNEDIQREANIEPMTTFLRKRRLRWYGHVLWKEGEDTTKKMLYMQVQGKRRGEAQ